EGDDKPAKYPAIFAQAEVLLINKVDLLAMGAVEFDLDRAQADATRLNKHLKIFPVSAKTGEGLEDWCDWLQQSVQKR
ncbi:MAG: hydrogenase accessory protein HypB, partial [Chlorobiales bacterium]|nr:hydrogenase accessory protein HypB [Chlorobiales bacterium]